MNKQAFKEWETLDKFSLRLAKGIKTDDKNMISENIELIEQQITKILDKLNGE